MSSIITPDTISILTANQEEIETLTSPYFDKLEQNLPLTPQEQAKFESLLKIYGDVCDEIDNYWRSMVRRPKKSLLKKLFRKN